MTNSALFVAHMKIDPAPGFRTELLAALDIMAPQIEGLEDLSVASMSAEATQAVFCSLNDRKRRRVLIRDVIEAMDVVIERWNALKDDGYPETPNILVLAGLFDELQKETDAIAAAMKIFEALPLASEIRLDLTVANRKET